MAVLPLVILIVKHLVINPSLVKPQKLVVGEQEENNCHSSNSLLCYITNHKITGPLGNLARQIQKSSKQAVKFAPNCDWSADEGSPILLFLTCFLIG